MEKSRVDGLDMWRAALLVGGPIVHSVCFDPHDAHISAVLFTITDASHLFRMAAFFGIAGFLASLNQSKEHWLRNRMRQLIVPLMTMIVVVLSVVYVLHLSTDQHDLSWNIPGHLWFLISLALMSPIVLVIDKIGIYHAITRLAEKNVFIFFCVMLVVTMTVNVMMTFVGWKFFKGQAITTQFNLTIFVQTPSFMCFYLLGFFVGRSSLIKNFLQVTKWYLVGIPFWIFAIVAHYYFSVETIVPNSNQVLKGMMLLLTIMSEFTMTITILSSALRISKPIPWVQTFSKSAYSVYLLHMPIILVMIVYGNQLLSINGYMTFTILAIGSLAISYLLHVAVISRSKLLLFLFNGKPYSLYRKGN